MRKFLYVLCFGSILLCFFQRSDVHASNIENDQIEVVMRRIGHEVLLRSNDSLSLVKPIVKEGNSYRIQFESVFSFLPDQLVDVTDSLIKSELPYDNYMVKVEECETKEVVYSYEINEFVQTDQVACKPRKQPEACYELIIQFTQSKQSAYNDLIVWIVLSLSVVLIVAGVVFKFKKQKKYSDAIKIGEYLYDAKKMVLIRKEKTIELTSKESALLNLLYESANQTLERDVILNKVWGDEGDYVGRTLDVYISKLRKKLDNDASVQLKNIRGIGYRLIIED